MKVKCTYKGGRNGWSKKVSVKKWFRTKEVTQCYKGPIDGEVVTVLKEFWKDGNKYYVLMEWPWPNEWGYYSGFFIPEEAEEEKFEEVKFEKIKKDIPIASN